MDDEPRSDADAAADETAAVDAVEAAGAAPAGDVEEPPGVASAADPEQPEGTVPSGSAPADAAVEEKPAVRSKGPRWRRALAWVFLVLGLVLLPLAVTGGWVRGNVFDTNGFVNIMGPLAADPAVQQQIATSLTNQIYDALDLEVRLQNVLPNRLGFLAGPIVDRLQARTLQGAEALVATKEFAAIWTKAVTAAHTALVGFFNGTGQVYLGDNGTITLDLSPISTRLVDRLAQVGIEISAQERPVLASGQVPIAQVAGLEKVKGLLNFVNTLFIVLPILAVLLLAGSVAVAVRRQRAAVRVGIGMMISMAIFVILIAVGHRVFLDATAGAGIASAAADALWGSLTIAMRATAWGLFVVGLLLLIHPYIVRAIRGDLVERAAGGAADRGWDTGPVGRFFARHRTWIALGVLVIGFLALVLSGGPPVWAIVLTAVLVIVVDAIVFFIARLSELATKERAEILDESAT